MTAAHRASLDEQVLGMQHDHPIQGHAEGPERLERLNGDVQGRLRLRALVAPRCGGRRAAERVWQLA